jgi:hypothetical protein
MLQLRNSCKESYTRIYLTTLSRAETLHHHVVRSLWIGRMKKAVPKLTYLSMDLQLSWTLAAFIQFLNLYRVGRTPWMGDQPVAKPLHTQNKRTQTSIPQVGFELRKTTVKLQLDQPLCEPRFETGTSSLRSKGAPRPTSKFAILLITTSVSLQITV